jgi:hypothetical protein
MRMLDTLPKIVYEGGPLVSVAYTIFGDDANFITAVGLRFELMSAVFRADADDDTLVVRLSPLLPEPEETMVEINSSSLWSACIGLGIRWAWRLTNQQGYSDGVRLEFADPNAPSSTVVELTVGASAIRMFIATEITNSR